MSIPVSNPELSKIYRLSGILSRIALAQIAQRRRDYMQSGEYVVLLMEVVIF